MSTTYDLILKKSNRKYYYKLVTKENVIFYEFIAGSWADAEEKARVYMSSWKSANITVDKNEQE